MGNKKGKQLTCKDLPNEDIEFICNKYIEGLPISKIASQSKHSALLCKRIVEECGIEKRKKYVRYKVNKDYFKIIDSEDKAYWLGFITADGCVIDSSGVTAVKIKLSRIDKGHLEKWRDSIESTHIIRDEESFKRILSNKEAKTYYASYLVFSCIAMVRDLEALGVIPNKSLVVRPCPNIPKDLLRHYWRGLVDGDGTLGIYDSRNLGISLCGSIDICEGFLSFIKDNGINTETKVLEKGTIWDVKFAGSYLYKDIANLLYKDCSIYLDRKYQLYLDSLKYEPSYKKHEKFSKEELLKMHEESGSWAEAARRAGIPETTIIYNKEIVGIPNERTQIDRSYITKELLLELFNKEGSWVKVAKVLEMSKGNLCKIKKARGIDSLAASLDYNSLKKEYLLSLFSQKKSWSKVADMVGVKRTYFYVVLKNVGIQVAKRCKN